VLASDAELRADMSSRGMAAVDGLGAARAVEAMLASFAKYKAGVKSPGNIIQ
jgi:hypothetical protein